MSIFIPVALLVAPVHREHRTGLDTSGKEQLIPSMSLAAVGFVWLQTICSYKRNTTWDDRNTADSFPPVRVGREGEAREVGRSKVGRKSRVVKERRKERKIKEGREEKKE